MTTCRKIVCLNKCFIQVNRDGASNDNNEPMSYMRSESGEQQFTESTYESFV